LEYEYEYRFTEYEYEEIRSDARTFRINRRRQVDLPHRRTQPPLDCIRFVGIVRLRSAAARATAARRDGDYPTAHGTRRQLFFLSRAVARGFSVPANHRRDGLVSRDDAHASSIPEMR
jgi:hypothetical protein